MINTTIQTTEQKVFLFFDIFGSVKVPVMLSKDKNSFKDLNDGTIHKRVENGKPTNYFNVEDYVSQKYNVERHNVKFIKINLKDLVEKFNDTLQSSI